MKGGDREMKIKAFVIDLDGTLLNSNKQVSERSCKALMNAHEQGFRIIIATARPPRAVARLLPENVHHLCSYIYYNGAMINCKKSNFLFHTSIDTDLAAEIMDYGLLLNPDIDLSIEVLDQWISPKEFNDAFLKSVGDQPEIMKLEQIKKLQPTKMMMSGFNNIDCLIDKFIDRVNILVTDSGQLIQISNLEATKELAVLKLCEIYGIHMNDVVVFGDDTNDLGLFHHCGHSVAMGNAIQELKDIATEITMNNDQDGVAIVIERICEKL